MITLDFSKMKMEVEPYNVISDDFSNFSLISQSFVFSDAELIYSHRNTLARLAREQNLQRAKSFNSWVKERPWFAVNGRRYIIRQTTFNDIVLDFIDSGYFTKKQSLDCSFYVKPNEVSELYLNDNHGFKAILRFKNYTNLTKMRKDSLLDDFLIEYNPYGNTKDRANVNSYIPFNLNENDWVFYTDQKPEMRLNINNTKYYRYRTHGTIIELWFDKLNGFLLAFEVRRL